MKRRIALVLCFLMLAALLPFTMRTASAETSGTCGDNLTWTLTDDGTLTISGTGEMDVYWWDLPWNDYNDDICRVIIEDGVTSIAGSAFSGCYNLVSAQIGKDVGEISWNPFSWCGKFEQITVDSCNTAYQVVDGVLFSMDGKELVTYPPQKDGSSYAIPDGVTWVKGNAFCTAKKLESVSIPATVTVIDGYSFAETGLKSVTIPDTVENVWGGAFEACTALGTVVIEGSETHFGFNDGAEDDGAFTNCPNLRSLTIPCDQWPYEHTFTGCYSLEELHLTVGTGEMNADMIRDLLYWYYFSEYYYWNEETQSWEDGELPAAKPLSVILDEGITVIPDNTFDSNYLDLDEDDYDFDSAIASVTLPASITEIGKNAFAYCGNLTDVYYGSTEEQKETIAISAGNEDLLNAEWHYKGDSVTIEGTVEWNSADVKFKGTTPYVIANGKAQTPRFTVKNKADGSVIDPANYDYEYRENTNAGTGYVIVTFKGDYEGTCRGFFKIYLPPTATTTVENVGNGIKLTWSAVPGADGYVIYRRAWSSTTDGWTDFVRWNNTTALNWIDTKVYAGTRYQYGIKAYFNKKVDPVTGATIGGNVGDNFNLGEVGPLKTTVRITTRTLNSVTAGTRQMTVKWGASSVFTGYQIQYATNSAFTQNAKAVKITNPKTVSTVIKSLTSGKTYYVRLRSYHVFNGMTYYGQWSNMKSCKVK